MKLLVDADIVTFRGAFSAEPPSLLKLLEQGQSVQEALDTIKYAEENGEWIANARTDGIIEEMVQVLGSTDTELWLSGGDNFRYQVFPEYKANRIKAKRPKWEQTVKQHLVDTWGAKWSVGCEADDMLGVRQMELMSEDSRGLPCANSIICSTDKDLDMIPGWHYNFVKKEKYYVTPEEAIRFFYYQCLIGDTADGIKGVPGIGPVKAKKLLDNCYAEEDGYGDSVEEQMYWAVRDSYSCYEEFEMNAKCLWIWRELGGIWIDKFKKDEE